MTTTPSPILVVSMHFHSPREGIVLTSCAQIGAGPSGLTAALALAKNNVPVRIVDKAPEFHKMTRGAGLHVRSNQLLCHIFSANNMYATHYPAQDFGGFPVPRCFG